MPFVTELDRFLTSLRASAEPTRLRILALCAKGDLTVSELVQILGQSQPRVSRHLKVLSDAGLITRFREGSWAFHRVAANARLTHALLPLLPVNDDVLNGDIQRLEGVKRMRADAASAYFRNNAEKWDRIRGLHVDEREVEATLVSLLGQRPIGDFLDVGTGTGRMLELFGPMAASAFGVDESAAMLSVARANLEKAGLLNCSVRQGDMYQLPFAAGSFDVVTIYQVLHFADRPLQAIVEAARMLRSHGRLAIVDFAPHDREELRTEHQHRRLGLSENEVAQWCSEAGLGLEKVQSLPGDPLTVTIWLAHMPDEVR